MYESESNFDTGFQSILEKFESFIGKNISIQRMNLNDIIIIIILYRKGFGKNEAYGLRYQKTDFNIVK